MSTLGLFLLVAFQIILCVVAIILFFYSTIVAADSIKGSTQFMLGFVLVLTVVFFGSFGWYCQGSTDIAENHWPSALQEGIFYTKVYSKEVLDVTNSDKHDGKVEQHFNVWLEWNNGNRACLYRLEKNPPDKFTVDGMGEFVKVD